MCRFDASPMELQLIHYWRVMQAGVTVTTISDYKDELDLLSLMTDWPALRATCQKSSVRFDSTGATVLRAAAI